MDDLASLRQLLKKTGDGDVSTFLAFLKNEGLELLASYRAIEDDEVRSALRKLVFNIALRRGPHRGGDNPAAA